MGKTLFDKIWDAHVVNNIPGGPSQLYIDRHNCQEVTSPQAFDGLRQRGLKVFRPEKTFCSPDHNIPTLNQDKPIADPVSRNQVETLTRNATDFGVTLFGLGHPKNGIIHVIGPENGLTLPGYTIVCGDSHTSPRGAFGAVAFGIGTSEVEMVLASQCILQPKPKTMRINVNGKLRPGVTAKDIALYIIAKMTTGGATGYFVEYAGEAIRNLSMEERMTVCNLSIEMGARGGMLAPDETIPSPDPEDEAGKISYEKSLEYMGFKAGQMLEGIPVDYVFLGSCTNGRIEDFRAFADFVKGKKKAPGVTAWLVPGSWGVDKQIREEGLDKILEEAGFEIRQPGCSACLGMTGRPLVAAAAAVTGVLTDPRK